MKERIHNVPAEDTVSCQAFRFICCKVQPSNILVWHMRVLIQNQHSWSKLVMNSQEWLNCFVMTVRIHMSADFPNARNVIRNRTRCTMHRRRNVWRVWDTNNLLRYLHAHFIYISWAKVLELWSDVCANVCSRITPNINCKSWSAGCQLPGNGFLLFFLLSFPRMHWEYSLLLDNWPPVETQRQDDTQKLKW